MTATPLDVENLKFAYMLFAAFITPIVVTLSLVYWKLYNNKLNEIADLTCEIENLKYANKDLKNRLEQLRSGLNVDEGCMTPEQKIQLEIGKTTIDVFNMIIKTLSKG